MNEKYGKLIEKSEKHMVFVIFFFKRISFISLRAIVTFFDLKTVYLIKHNFENKLVFEIFCY